MGFKEFLMLYSAAKYVQLLTMLKQALLQWQFLEGDKSQFMFHRRKVSMIILPVFISQDSKKSHKNKD